MERKCQNCQKGTAVPNKSYVLCERARTIKASSNPYRRFNDSCPAFEERK